MISHEFTTGKSAHYLPEQASPDSQGRLELSIPVESCKPELLIQEVDPTQCQNLGESKVRIEQKSFDVDAKSNDGHTALHFACANGCLEVAKYLVEKENANVNIQDIRGWTTLHHASVKGHLEVIKYLLDKGVAVDTANNDGHTALHFAFANGRLEVANYLVEKGNADVSILDKRGCTALYYADLNSGSEVTQHLENTGAALEDVRDNYGSTTLRNSSDINSVVEYKLNSMRQLLRERGCSDKLRFDKDTCTDSSKDALELGSKISLKIKPTIDAKKRIIEKMMRLRPSVTGIPPGLGPINPLCKDDVLGHPVPVDLRKRCQVEQSYDQISKRTKTEKTQLRD